MSQAVCRNGIPGGPKEDTISKGETEQQGQGGSEKRLIAWEGQSCGGEAVLTPRIMVKY